MDEFRFDGYDFVALCEQAIAAKAAQRNYERAFAKAIERAPTMMDKDDILPTDKFWQCLEKLRKVLAKGYKAYNAKWVLDEFCRQTATGENGISMEEQFSLLATYKKVSSRLYKAFDGIDMGRGDDSFGDLMDLLPLAGKPVVVPILTGQVLSLNKLEELLGGSLDAKTVNYILNREEYFQTTWEEKLSKFFCSYVRKLAFERVE